MDVGVGWKVAGAVVGVAEGEEVEAAVVGAVVGASVGAANRGFHKAGIGIGCK